MIMTYEEALQIAQDMYIESGATDLELGAAQVLRDLHTIANNTSCPLVQVEAIEILFALAQGPDNDTSWIPPSNCHSPEYKPRTKTFERCVH